MGYRDELLERYEDCLNKIETLIANHNAPVDAFYYGIQSGKIKTRTTDIAWLEETIERLENTAALMEEEISRIQYKKKQGTYIPDKMKYL
jgi:hypothetical protein